MLCTLLPVVVTDARVRYLVLARFLFLADFRGLDGSVGGVSSLPRHRRLQGARSNTASCQRERVQSAGLPRLP